MAATNRFEVHLPYTQSGSSDFTAVQNFISSMNGLVKCYKYAVFLGDDSGQVISFYGYVTTAQSSIALGFLSTLNSSLSTGPVVCVAWPGTTEP